MPRSTVTKQRAHRRGQAFTTADYRRVQDMLDKGVVLKESATHLQIFQNFGGKVWKAVIKRTKVGNEVYLLSLHRFKTRRLRSAKKKYPVLIKGGK